MQTFFQGSQELNETASISGYPSFLYKSQARYFLPSKLKVWTPKDSRVSEDMKLYGLWVLLMLEKKKSFWSSSYSELSELMTVTVPNSTTFTGPYLVPV